MKHTENCPVTQYYKIWNDPKLIFTTDIFAEDFSFCSPLEQINSKEEYVDMLNKTKPTVIKISNLCIISDKEQDIIAASFNFETKIMFPERMAAFFVIKDNKITKLDVYFDPRQILKAKEQSIYQTTNGI